MELEVGRTQNKPQHQPGRVDSRSFREGENIAIQHFYQAKNNKYVLLK